jgi:N-acetylglucosaminyldiphosphoundecaprenol N-acetyl-beta-D-mannosaminyltransferase
MFEINLLNNGCDILNVNFNLIAFNDVMDVIEYWRQNNESNYITITNPHSVMLCYQQKHMMTATKSAGMTLPDGIGIVMAANILGFPHNGRIAGPDLMLKLCDHGREQNYRHYFYGGAEGVADKLAERLSKKYPGLKVAGKYCPPFRELSEQEDSDIVEMINDTKPDVLWVGLGAPKQEKWMYDHLDRIKAAAMIGVGAAFDFHSGNVARAPGWTHACGMEWFHRLVVDPKRMWRRYIVNSPLFLLKVMAQKISMLSGKKQPVSNIQETIEVSQLSPKLTGKQRISAINREIKEINAKTTNAKKELQKKENSIEQ